MGLFVAVGCGWDGGLVAVLVVVSCLIFSMGLILAMGLVVEVGYGCGCRGLCCSCSFGCVGFGFGCVVASGVVLEVVVPGWKVFMVDIFYFILMNSLYYFNQIAKNIDPLMLGVL